MSRYAPHRKLWLLVKLIFPAMLHLRTGGNIFDYPVGVRMRRLSLCFQRSFTGTARQRSGMSTPERCWDIASVFRATNCKEATRRLLSSLVSGKETADALKRLRDAGFITLDLRTVEMLDGVKCSNILFVGINPQAIAAITTPSSVSPESNSNNAISDTAITLKRNTPDVITEQGIRRMLIQIQRLLQRLQRRLKTLLMHPLTRLRVLPDRNIHRNLNRPGRNIPNVLVAIPSQQPSKPGKPVSGRE